MRWMAVAGLVLSVAMGASAAEAVKAATLDDAGKKKAEAAIKDLSSDSFETRNNAEKTLTELMPAALPLVKDTLAGSKDAEVKSRLEKVMKVAALDTCEDPDLLARYAKEDAVAKHFDTAAKFYEKAAKLFKTAAEKASDEAAKKDLTAKAELATTREKRAEYRAKNAANGNANGVHIAVQGGGNGQAVVVSTVKMVVNDGSGAVDVTSEDW